MKEYKVVVITFPQKGIKTSEALEDVYNKVAAEGWELKFITQFYCVFERDK